jgi:hypothetical protein
MVVLVGLSVARGIVARGYGIPCVTGIPETPFQIERGNQVVRKGELGIATIGCLFLGRRRSDLVMLQDVSVLEAFR